MNTNDIAIIERAVTSMFAAAELLDSNIGVDPKIAKAEAHRLRTLIPLLEQLIPASSLSV